MRQIPFRRCSAFESLESRRLLSAGDLDPSFDGDGMVVSDINPFSDGAVAIAAAPDGGSFAVGHNNGRYLTLKYTAAGALDPAFGIGGAVTATLDTLTGASGVVVSSSGRPIVFGQRLRSGVPENEAAILRYLPSGAPDNSWDGDGVRILDAGTRTSLSAAVIQPGDDKVIFVGTVDSNVLIARYHSSGSPDLTFDGDGWATYLLGGWGAAAGASVALQPDGKILVGAILGANDGGAVLRLNSDGTPDNTFHGDGWSATIAAFRPHGVGVASDGKVLAGGNMAGAFGAARFTSTGDLDLPYGGGDGRAQLPVGTFLPNVGKAVITPRGQAVVVGSVKSEASILSEDFAIVRFDADGVSDSAFGSGGVATTDFPPGGLGDRAAAIVQQPDGKLLVAGTQFKSGDERDLPIARYLGDAAIISGHLYDDVNSNGIEDAGESPLAGHTIYLDLDASNTLTAGDVTTLTNAAGAFTFADVAGGTYTVRVAMPNGFRAVTPGGTIAPKVTVGATDATGLVFGRQQFAFLVGRRLHLRGTTSGDILTLGRVGDDVTVSRNGGTSGANGSVATFAAADFDDIAADLLGGINSLQLYGDMEYVLAPGTLTSAVGDEISVAGSGPVNIAASLTLPDGANLRALYLGDDASASLVGGAMPVLQTKSLSLKGRLDIGMGALIVDYSSVSPIGTWNGSVYSGTTGQITHALTPGAYGIASAAAASSGGLHAIGVANSTEALGITASQTTTWRGHTIDGTAVLVRYTWGGDANLDGKIDVDDYGQIDFHVGSSGIVFGWFNGDFNFDGKINIDDYGIIDFNVSAQDQVL